MAAGASIARDNEARETREDSQTESLSLEGQIGRHAREIWLRRDGGEGSDVADWLEAEKETVADKNIYKIASNNTFLFLKRKEL